MSDNNTPAPVVQQIVQIEDHTVGIGQWILIFLVQGIPVIGLIMLLILALDSSNRTRANYARAIFVLILIGIILAVCFWGVFAAAIAKIASQAS